MPEITVIHNQTRTLISYQPGMSVRDILETTVFKLRSSCGGTGKCGLCLVSIESGEVNPPARREREMLDERFLAEGIRLSCMTKPLSGNVVINKNSPVPKSIWFALDDTDRNFLQKSVTMKKTLPADQRGIGISIDIGTTYIRCAFWNLEGVEYLGGYYALNPQVSAGTDVLTRLMFAAQLPENALELSELVRYTIAECLENSARLLSISMSDFSRITIVGNTAMLSLFCLSNYQELLEPGKWGQEISYQIRDTENLKLLWGCSEAMVDVVPGIAGFIGSDLLAGIIATSLTDGLPGSLLIDFGTNTEIALWDGSVIWTTSAPGGPAFEGSGISCGMNAERGAIFKVHLSGSRESAPENYSFDVIGGGVNLGICGSGLIDSLAALLKTGQINTGGQLRDTARNRGFALLGKNSEIILKRQDIDALQRAKASVSAGIQILMNKSGISVENLNKVFISGTFGQYLNITNAKYIGLLPQIPDEKIELCGNSSLAGCSLLLMSRASADEVYRIKSITFTVNLAMESDFDDIFIDNLYIHPITSDKG